MSQDAGAGDANQSKRFQNPAHVYGQMVYQFPSEQGGENENMKLGRFQNVNFLSPALIIALAVGGAILYMKGNGMEVGQLNFGRAISGQPLFGREVENQIQPRVLSRARVAANSLYMREGPGTRYAATYLLPENWGVSLMGDYQTDDRGEVWARVTVETEQGPQEGWVSRKFLRF
jgi:hypothetical protein